jgi:lamin tail-like protein
MKAWFAALILITSLIVAFVIPAEATGSQSIVISQLYLGAPTSPSLPTYPYVELFNLGTDTVNMQGWSLQYAEESANSWTPYPLSGSIAPGQYFLIRLTGSSLSSNPQPDLTIGLALPRARGKIAIVTDSTPLGAGCPVDDRILDRLGYGSTACYETQPQILPNEADPISQMRKNGGCTDNDQNANDFSRVTPLPRNTSSARNLCNSSSSVGVRTLSISSNGGTSFQSSGSSSNIKLGYSRVQTDTGSTPAGVAIYGLRQGGTLVTETGVPAVRPITNGFGYVEIAGSIKTGVAIANPNNDDVTIDYSIADSNNLQNTIDGEIILSANTQLARFLDEPPFAVKAITGTITFTASVPVAVTILRGFTNERGEFLVSTLPVVETPIQTTTTPGYLPHFAVGGGWRTEVIIVNPIDTNVSGTLAFFDAAGNPVTVPIGSVTVSTVDYTLPGRRTLKFVLPNTGTTIQSGAVRVVPLTGDKTPMVLGVFSFSKSGVRVSEAALLGLRGTQFRTYMESAGTAGTAGAILSGLAIGNADGVTVAVNLEAFRLDGTSTGQTATITIPVGGKAAKFSNEIFPSLPLNFRGIVKFTASGNVSVAGLRGRYNEREDFLITTVPLSPEVTGSSNSEVVFPHLVDGGGYTTQFVLFSSTTDQGQTGSAIMRSIGGQRLDLSLQ